MRRLIWISLLLLSGMIGMGCAAPSQSARTWSHPVWFPAPDATPAIAVYGNLGDVLPQHDATPALERWLYGPSDFGKTMLRNPQGMTLLDDRLLVCDQGQEDVIAIHLTTGETKPWTDRNQPPRCPVDIAADDSQRVFVADTTRHAVLVYNSAGGFVEELTPSEDPDRKYRPCAVLAHEGILYIADSWDRQIDRWDLAGRRRLSPWVAPANQAKLIAPTGLAMTSDGTLLVCDAVSGCVFRVARDGRWLTPIGKPGRGKGEFVRPKQVCCTPSGLIVVTDAGRQSVLVFAADGAYLMEILEKTDQWAGLTLPTGLVAVSPNRLPAVVKHLENKGLPQPDEMILVSDSLGGEPLTVMGVTLQPAEKKADAK